MQKKYEWKLVIWCFVIAFIQLTICSRSSFLYPMNNWDDANSFLTMAKGLANGMVLYRDLYDQKGVYLYLMYMVANTIVSSSFLGVYFIELVMGTLSLLGFYGILRLYLKKVTSILCLPILYAVICSSISFHWGASAEELIMPAFIYTLYVSLRYFKNQYPENMKNQYIVQVGVLAGVVALYKYTLLGLFFAFMMMIALTTLGRKQVKVCLQQCGLFLVSMVATWVPWILYFGVQGAIGDWIEGYIYYNLTYYGNFEVPLTLANRIYVLAKTAYWILLENVQYIIFIVIGFFYYLCSLRTKIVEKLNLLALGFFTYLFIYIGMSHLRYYAIPLTIFTVMGFVALGVVVEKVVEPYRVSNSYARTMGIVAILCVVGTGCFSYMRSQNTFLMAHEKDTFYLYELAEVIQQEEAPTLLNYGFLDVGLYTVCDIVPTCRFFQRNWMDYNAIHEEQVKYVQEARTEFVVTKDEMPEFFIDTYELVKEVDSKMDGYYEATYYLYKRKES